MYNGIPFMYKLETHLSMCILKHGYNQYRDVIAILPHACGCDVVSGLLRNTSVDMLCHVAVAGLLRHVLLHRGGLLQEA
jgi:hypothetical protein